MQCLCAHMEQLNTISTHKKWISIPTSFVCKINIHDETYLIVLHINDCLSIKCNTVFGIVYIMLDFLIILTNSSGADRYAHSWCHEYSTLMPQIQDIHVSKIAWSSCLSQLVNQCELRFLLLLPWCITITGYHTSNDNGNNQSWLATNKQANRYQAQVSQEEWKLP